MYKNCFILAKFSSLELKVQMRKCQIQRKSEIYGFILSLQKFKHILQTVKMSLNFSDHV